MSEQLKFIVDHLNQKPFNKSYNLIRWVILYLLISISFRFFNSSRGLNILFELTFTFFRSKPYNIPLPITLRPCVTIATQPLIPIPFKGHMKRNKKIFYFVTVLVLLIALYSGI